MITSQRIYRSNANLMWFRKVFTLAVDTQHKQATTTATEQRTRRMQKLPARLYLVRQCLGISVSCDSWLSTLKHLLPTLLFLDWYQQEMQNSRSKSPFFREHFSWSYSKNSQSNGVHTEVFECTFVSVCADSETFIWSSTVFNKPPR